MTVRQGGWARRKKTRERLWLVLTGLVIAATGALILRNNPEVIDFARGASSMDSLPSSVGQYPDAGVSIPARESGDVVSFDDSGPAEEPPQPSLRMSVMIPGIRSPLQDRPDLNVIVSLELFFTGDSLRDEILLKRDGLKVMAHTVIAGKTLDKIVLESLRREMMNKLNGFLKKGSLEDVEFRDFRIDKADME